MRTPSTVCVDNLLDSGQTHYTEPFGGLETSPTLQLHPQIFSHSLSKVSVEFINCDARDFSRTRKLDLHEPQAIRFEERPPRAKLMRRDPALGCSTLIHHQFALSG